MNMLHVLKLSHFFDHHFSKWSQMTANSIAFFRFFIPLCCCLLPTLARAQTTFRANELRNKKLIDAGIYTLDSSPIPVHSKTLAQHPNFTETHPFDGIALRVLLDKQWCDSLNQKLSKKNQQVEVAPYLDAFAWSKLPVPFEAIRDAITDLNQVRWGSLTDNFLWCNFRGSEELLRANILSDSDWAAVLHNARMLGRVCKQAKLKGLLLDTEQYTRFDKSNAPYPLGLGTAELRRERGKRWIQALQSESPEIRIIIFFAWSPDLGGADFLRGVGDFLDGMLEGIESPGQLIHGYENTFYYGQAKNSRFNKEGFRGDRARYDEYRALVRDWRKLSSNPLKYDKFVRVGMAAWLESDPWNLWNGWPSGTKDTIWSNVPMALATTDQYVWCWSEHTNYFHQHSGENINKPSMFWLNPYLASLTNQTFNRGTEQTLAFEDAFDTDPLLSGWYFDFDMLKISRQLSPDQAIPIPDRDAVSYAWSPTNRAIQVEEKFSGEESIQHGRYVHPIHDINNSNPFRVSMDFQVTSFGNPNSSPIKLGMFDQLSPESANSIFLQIDDANTFHIKLNGKTRHWTSPQFSGLKKDHILRFEIEYPPNTTLLQVALVDRSNEATLCHFQVNLASEIDGFRWDEVGLAITPKSKTVSAPTKGHQYRMNRVSFQASN
jgi:hypothetical protein